MAPAIAHFLVGASLLVVLTIPIVLRYRLPPWIPLWLVALGGLWGLGPDIHHIAPVYEFELRAVHDSPVADLFAFHYTLDRPVVRAQYISSVFGSIVGFLVATTAFVIATVVRTRTDLTKTIPLPLVALSEALLFVLLFIGATSYPA